MADIPRIDVQEARRKVQSGGDTLLVCAYDDEEKCRQNNLQGSISMKELRARTPSLDRGREIIFYCA